MNVLLLGFTVPRDCANALSRLDSRPAIQTCKFAWSLARALEAGLGKVFLASAVPIQNFPHGRKVLFRGTAFVEHGMQGVMLGFLNLLVLKHLTRMVSCLWRLPGLIRRNRIKLIVVHGIHTPFLAFGLLGKLFGVRLIVMVTDPPGVLLPTDRWLERTLKQIDRRIVGWLLRRADGVMCLSPGLAEYFRISRPNVCFPGILSSDFEAALAVAEANLELRGESASNVCRTILYAGGLNKAYGVDKLIEAISLLKSPRLRLSLFGAGDQVANLRRRAKDDERFSFGGFVSDDELVPALLNADVLVNPRPADEAFAILSFPSKLVEYLASGTPVLTTRISSIPRSLAPYFSYIEVASPEGIRDAIIRLLDNYDEGLSKARAGRVAVARELSEEAIGMRISSLVETITSNGAREI